MKIEQGTSSQMYTADPKFTFKDGNVTFVVEGVLFTVHRHFFERDSPCFRKLFQKTYGETPDKPLVVVDSETSKKGEDGIEESGIGADDYEVIGDSDDDEDENATVVQASSYSPKASQLSTDANEEKSCVSRGTGTTAADPIVLDDLKVYFNLGDLKANEFRDFLCILYPPRFGKTIFKDPNRWKNVLTVASYYEFSDIRSFAISKIQSKSSCGLFKLRVGREFGIRSLLLAGYEYFINRSTSMTAGEMKDLELEDIANIVSMRETHRFTDNVPNPVLQADILSRFKEIFDDLAC
ncbi:hypothetical protein SCHPADRAFT_996106 [Schizopora paradoxa]|uniref:BTB domain-containing protein n=1 Tax=Schizopora paradoxa TaxID=27342 RepID=A0A0H2SDP0_9AGAM|nr:hypothetical protein SCHPADRAFT_996106 [Schizopora paradoxa]